MSTPACFRPSSYFHSSSSRPAKHGIKHFLGRAAPLLSLFLIGSSAFAQVRLAPSTLSFGNRVVNQSSAAMSATLKNTQAVPLSISGIAISGGTAPADYVAGGNCPVSPSTLGPGENCNITLTFTPSAPGLRTATLTLTDDAHTTPATVSLRGMGVAPVDTTPGGSNIGAVAVGYTGATPSGTLTN
ncbi:MAG: choice-of-anchor D domain-containing protein, partial [Terriglobia bacterium]